MKKLVGLWVWVHLFCACIPVFSQIDTTYIYNTAMPYGTLDLRIAKSDTRYYYLQEDVTFSYRESAPGVKSNTFRDMTSWNSSPYRQGNLREKNGAADLFVMNYRFLLPAGYNASYDPGYPIIIMFHGLGERGNCWDDNCYWSTTNWNPNTNSPPAPTSVTNDLMNNDHNLLHGGLKHLNAVNLAGSKLPNDPTLAPAAFPGILVFPQNLNGWGQASKVEDAVRLLRLMLKKYNVDENRVYIHGLSNGGGAVFQAIKRAPWLFAAALPMSAINNGGIIGDGLASEVGKIPLRIFQGGQDKNPTPSRTYNTVKNFREAGANIRYYLYENLGHGTWNTAYNEPDFFSWILSQRKYNPHVYYGNPVICNTTGAGVNISFSNGFPAYQWEFDGVVITNASQSQFIANTPGTYRGRFSRKPNPAEGDWQPWSDPIVVRETNPVKPKIDVTGTTHLRGPGLASTAANNTVVLRSSPEAELYTWYKNGVVLNFPSTDVNDTLRTASFTSSSTGANGAYTLVTSYSYCPSPPSDPVYLFFNNSAPQNIIFNAVTADLKGMVMPSGIFLTWNDVASSEIGYEIWRKKSGTTDFKFAGRTAKDAISFYDGPLEPSTTYLYKIRAIGKTGASSYVPSNDVNINYQITTSGDQKPPSPPQQLMITGNTLNSISLSWKPSADNTGIKSYIITFGGTVVNTDSTATAFTIAGLPPNTTYPITVKAVDLAGHVSQPSNQVLANTYVLGLFYKHSTGAWRDLDDTTLTETWIKPEFTGSVNNFSLVPRTQEDFFNFQFTGYFDVPTEGDYIFRLTSDDGSRMLLDNAVIADNDGTHGNVTVFSDTLHLSAGAHPLQVQYFDYSGGQSLTVQYKGPLLTSSFVAIPDSLLRSGKYVAPTPPAAPVNLLAQGSGMQQVNLSWQSPVGTEAEIYRAPNENAVFNIVGRTDAALFADTAAVIPGTTYFYKVRTVNGNGASPFTNTVSASTASDTQAPAVPQSLLLSNKTHTLVTLGWTASTDNVKVTGYEVFVNGQLAGTTPLPVFTISALLPNTAYTIAVKAIDASNNKSALSQGLVVTTNPSAIYYSLAAGDLNLVATWKQNVNGTGASPESFTENGQYFVISNRTQTGMGGDWEVSGSASKVIVPAGVILNVDHAFTAQVELEGTAVLNLDHTIVPELLKLSTSSTVNFNIPSFIPRKSYGNISLTGTGSKNFESDVTTIAGNLTISNGLLVKGASGNTTALNIGGNLIINGSTGATASDNRINIVFSENGTHTISAGDNLFFYGIATGTTAVVNVQNSGSPIRIVLGSTNGGGLSLAGGSSLNLSSNTLSIVGAATVNKQNETGRIAVSGGDLRIFSSASQNSNLYFDAINNTLDTLRIDLAGTGNVSIHEPLKISGSLWMTNGTLDTGGQLTLLSTAAKTASIAAIENGVISGNVNVQQYLEPMGNHWRDLSTSVSGVTVSHWQNYFPVTGQFTGASAGQSSEPSMFISNGTGLIAYPSTGGTNQAPIEKGKGYSTRINQTSAITLNVTGNPFQNNISFALTGGTGGGADNGWNLVGNPYASPIVWSDNSEAWLASSVSSTIAIRENKLVNGQPVGQYRYYHPQLGAGLVPAGQAFWIQAFSSTPALTITEKAKATNLALSPAEPSMSDLVVSLNQGALSDPAYILFTEEGTDGFDNAHDALKKLNEGMFNLSAIIGDNINAAITTLSNSFCSKVVKLNIRNVSPGNYSLGVGALSILADISSVTLTDNFTGNVIPIGTTPYAFSITSDANTYGANRFSLTFSRSQLDIVTPQVKAANVCRDDEATVTILHSQPGVEYVVLNKLDAIISDVGIGGAETVTLTLQKTQLNSGSNQIRVRAGFNGCTSQLLTSHDDFIYTPSFSLTVQEDISVCLGEQAMLQVSGVPSGGSYKWYDENETLIVSETDATLVTGAMWEETVYKVEGVNAAGCASEKENIHVYADTLELPVITLYSDTLFTQAEAISYQWKTNGQNISNATYPFYRPAASGLYTVIAFKGGCSKESAGYEYVIDPDCALDSTTPVATANDSCEEDMVPITITPTQTGVIYTAINKNGEVISASKTGNGETVRLEIDRTALDSGANEVQIKADLTGCVDRLLASVVKFNYIPPFDVPVIVAEENSILTEAQGPYQWKKDGEIIGDVTDAMLTPLASGNYTVVIFRGDCWKESEPFSFSVTAIENGYGREFVLNTYPVPSTGDNFRISVQSPRPDRIYVEIIDITGRPVFRQSYAFSELSQGIPITPVTGPFPNGIYCVIATQGKTEVRRRIIIKN